MQNIVRIQGERCRSVRVLAMLLFAAVLTPNADAARVQHIPLASTISSWATIDTHRLVVSTSPSKNYLVTLRRGCFGLRFAETIALSTSNNTVYAGFDYVAVDGQRCPIASISALEDDLRG